MVNRCTLCFRVLPSPPFLFFAFPLLPLFVESAVQRWEKTKKKKKKYIYIHIYIEGEGKRTTGMHFVDVVRIVGLNFSKCHARYLSCQDGIGPRANIHARCTPLESRAAVVTTVARSRSVETENERNKTEK